MMRFLETLAGTILVVVAVSCVPLVMRKPSTAALPTVVCDAPIRRAPLLCNRVMKDGGLECAVCDNANRMCTTTTHLYCAASCDDTACVARGK